MQNASFPKQTIFAQFKLAYCNRVYNHFAFESSYFFKQDRKSNEKVVVNICVFLLNNLLLKHPTIF